jgi:hypothetical protein
MSMSNSNDEVRQTVDGVLKRDRRRIRILAGITIALWVGAFLFLPSIYMPAAAKVKKSLADIVHSHSGAAPLTAQELADKLAPIVSGVTLLGLLMTCAVLFIEVLAAISTVALVLTIRRVTLRQVNENLAEISAQLKKLDRAGP